MLDWHRSFADAGCSNAQPKYSASSEAIPGREGGREPSKRLRFLLVDDNEDAVFSLERLLRLLGHEAKATTSGMAALAEGGSFEPDVVLLDLGMPGMDGFETSQAMRRQGWGARIPIIALTGWGAAEDRRRTRDAGFYGHLVKPLKLEALFELLEQKGSADQA